jgi:hypothetical protein
MPGRVLSFGVTSADTSKTVRSRSLQGFNASPPKPLLGKVI